MLQIRLRKPSSDGGATAKPAPVDSVTVACPDHLILADLPVAKGLGSVNTAAVVKNIGRRSRRQLGERVHFCVRCDFPIAIYGRLSPCDHAFCRDCARSDPICYLCDERIHKIQTIKMMEGIVICAAPHCLKSFLRRADFESHIQEKHANLLQSNVERDAGNGSEAISTKQNPSESTARAPTRPAFSPNSSSQGHDRPRDLQLPRPTTQQQAPPQLPYFGQMQHNFSDPSQSDKNAPPGFERAGPQNSFAQQNFDNQVRMQQESGQLHDYPPMQGHQPNFAVPINSNQVMGPPQFGYPPFMPAEGAHPFFEMARPDSATGGVGADQGSLLGFPPGQIGNFTDGFPRPWNMMMPAGMPFDPNGPQGVMDGFSNMSDPQGRGVFFQGGGDYGRNGVVLPSNMPPPSPGNKGMETGQGGNGFDPRDGKGILAPPALPFHQPPHHLSQHKRENSYSGDMGRDGRGYGWQQDKHDSYGSGQD